jgi:hypothetical protein
MKMSVGVNGKIFDFGFWNSDFGIGYGYVTGRWGGKEKYRF